MEEVENPFNKFFGYLMIFAFLVLFCENFKANMERRNEIQNVAQNKTQIIQPAQQIVYRRVYINNNGGPATVYYVRQ